MLNFEPQCDGDYYYMHLILFLQISNLSALTKSAVISTQRWTNSLGTAHSKMGGPTFVNEKVVHILEKQNNIILNFVTKCDGDYYYVHLN